MKTFKQLVSEVYKPNTKDEADLIGKHVIKVFDYPVKNKNGLPFKDDSIRAPGPQHKKAPYHPPEQPAQVYQQTNEEEELTVNGRPYGKWPNYHMTYEKGPWDESHQVVLKSLDMRNSKEWISKEKSRYHDEDGPGTPQRVTHLVKNHPEHKEMLERGFRVKEYGVHAPSMHGKTISEGYTPDTLEEAKHVIKAYADRPTDDLLDMHSRWKGSIENLPKKGTYATYGHAIDKEFYIRKALEQKGVNVEKPKHPLVIEDFISLKEAE